MFSTPTLLALTTLATTISAHGIVSTPTARSAGAAMKAACGQQVYNNQASDAYGNVQAELQVASSQSDYNAAECELWLCKGYKFADNTANVQSYTPGQVVDIGVTIHAPHTGTMNMSVVDTATNTQISDNLVYYPVYASTATSIPSNNTAFSITMPDLGSKCDVAGACVIQWFWNAESIDQTYESCIDFTMGGSSSSSSSNSTNSAAGTTSVAAAAAAVASTKAALPTTLQTSVRVSSSDSSVTTPAVGAKLAVAATGIPKAALTSVISVASATATVTGTNGPAAMPAGTTLEDILSWLGSYLTSLMN